MSATGSHGRLLVVSYFYPPTRDTGAQRPAAMAKWLARLGWEVTVLTTSAFGAGGEGGGPDPVRVIRTGDLQCARARLAGHDQIDSLFDSDTYSGRPHPLSKVLVPEPLVLAWAPFAIRAARAEHRRLPFDCVLTTSPPESAHAVGRALQKRGARWVADVRDAWTFEPLRPPFPTRAQDHLDSWLERRWLGSADAVVCVSEPAAADLRARGIADPAVIPNAWDPDSAPAPAPADDQGDLPAPFAADRTTLLYTGRFGSYGRDPEPFVRALAQLAATSPDQARKLEVAVAGPLQPGEWALLERDDLAPVRVTLLGSVSRERALVLQRVADALLLLAQPTRSQLVNFKLFEYLASGTPILALAAGTEAGRLAAEAGVDPLAPADDPTAIAAALGAMLEDGLAAPAPGAAARHRYPAAAERMDETLTPDS